MIWILTPRIQMGEDQPGMTAMDMEKDVESAEKENITISISQQREVEKEDKAERERP